MGDVKNLTSAQAHEKVKELGMEIQTCMFCTYVRGRLVSRPMSTQKIDDGGNVWFLSARDSSKNQEINDNPFVDLVYSHGNEKFLSLHGEVTVSTDKLKIRELWTPIAKIWFTGGVDDPRLSVIKVAVQDGYYWDTKHGKMIELTKMAAALVTGKTMDDGIEGTIRI